MSFADPTSDIAFKKIFGNQERRHILISFLNAALGFTGKAAIADLEILAPNQAPHLKDFYDSTLDVRAKDKAGREFIVEMQVEDHKDFGKRACYYSAKAYSQQLRKKGSYANLRPVIFLGILNFSFFDGDDFLTRHLVLNQKTLKQELPDFEFAFIELKKFLKDEAELVDIIDKWTYFIKHAGSLKKAPKVLTKVPEINEAFEIADQHLWTPEELHVYDYWLDRERVRLSALQTAKEKTQAAIKETRAALKEARAAKEKTRAAEKEARAAEKKTKAAEKEARAAEKKLLAESQARQKAEERENKAKADKQRAEAKNLRDKFVAAEAMRADGISDVLVHRYTGIDAAQLDVWIRSGRT